MYKKTLAMGISVSSANYCNPGVCTGVCNAKVTCN